MSTRKLIYYVACTIDGFIAGEDGSYDFFLTEGEHFADLLRDFPETFPAPAREALGLSAENQRFDTVLMGRHTYEVGAKVGLTNPYPQMKQYVLSRSMGTSPDAAVELISDDAVSHVRELKHQAGSDIWLCGGGALAGELFSEIDELILKVHPVVIGAGIPVFRAKAAPTRLEMIERKPYSDGFVRVHARLDHRSR